MATTTRSPNSIELGDTTYRRPTDILFLAAGLVLLFLTAFGLMVERGIFRSADVLFQNLNLLPDSLALARAGIQFAPIALAVLGVGAAALTARPLLARNLAAAGIVAFIVSVLLHGFAQGLNMRSLSDVFLLREVPPHGLGTPSIAVSILAALATVSDPFVPKRARAVAWSLTLVLTAAALYVGAAAPIEALGGIALGVVLGAVVNLALGVPEKILPSNLIRQAFQERDLVLKEVRPISADARGSVPYFARGQDGQDYFIKLVGTQQRNADMLFKLWRATLFRNVASAAPYLTPMQQIEHEAYLTLLAQKHGVRTPDVEFTARIGDDHALLAQKRVEGARELADLKDKGIHAALLAAIWDQVNKLHEARIYHGDLRLANILVDDKGKPWIIDFGFSTGDASDTTLGLDTAQLLASLSAVIGEERSVAAARKALGDEALVAAVPNLEPLILSSATRADMKEQPKLLEEIKEEIEDKAETAPAQEESVFRIRKRNVLLILGLGIGMYALLPQLAQLNKVVEIWGQARWPLVLVGALGSLFTYLMAAVGQQGAVPQRLSLVKLTVTQFAATFASRLSPQGLGAAFVLERFLEASGLDRVQALTAFGVNALAGALVHLALTLAVLPFIGVSGASFLKGIQPWMIAAVLVAIMAAVVLVMRSPKLRDKITKSSRESFGHLKEALKNPLRAVELFGGSLFLTLGYMATFMVSLWAIGVNVSPFQVAATYLVGSVVGTASPTPGGLGVTESALAAGLIAFGVPSNQAVAGVLLYRFLTFWLPILPGLLAFRYLKRKELV